MRHVSKQSSSKFFNYRDLKHLTISDYSSTRLGLNQYNFFLSNQSIQIKPSKLQEFLYKCRPYFVACRI